MSAGQITGMRGVYLVAAELAKRSFIATPTSRSTRGADLFVSNRNFKRTFAVEVKTKRRTSVSWPLSAHVLEINSANHIYVLVNLLDSPKMPRGGGLPVEYFIVPSKIMRKLAIDYRPEWKVS